MTNFNLYLLQKYHFKIFVYIETHLLNPNIFGTLKKPLKVKFKLCELLINSYFKNYELRSIQFLNKQNVHRQTHGCTSLQLIEIISFRDKVKFYFSKV